MCKVLKENLHRLKPIHHYWKRVFCRGPNLGHSAKTLFAEGRQLRPLTKKSPRQRPSVKTPSAILVYWVTAAEPRQHLPRPNRQALGKDFLFFFANFFAEGLSCSPRQRPPLPRAMLGPRQRNYFFWIFESNFFRHKSHYFKHNFKNGTNFTFLNIFFEFISIRRNFPAVINLNCRCME